MISGELGRRTLVVGVGAAAICSGCSADFGDLVESVAPSNGFGADINVGQPEQVIQTIRDNGGFWYRPDGRMWLVEYPAHALESAREVYSASELAGMQAGVVALFQKCPHLGCRVPSCATSQWFECPCHGSKYNRVGEKRGGPAPRGMDRFAIQIASNGDLVIRTGQVIQGPTIGTNTTGQEIAGPYCIGEPRS